MNNWRSVLVRPDATIREAIRVIDTGALKIALVVDEHLRLLGTVSDGDVRRGILAGEALEGRVDRLMNRQPLCTRPGDEPSHVLKLMRQRGVHQIPVTTPDGEVVGMETIDDLLQAKQRENPVVLMAGGLGSRLRPLTNNCPKPMLRIGDRPILETILTNFIRHGFRRFYMAVNYRAELIQQHFGDGSNWGVEISYLHEREPLGTAGALSLLPERPTMPLFCMNGDILARVNFGAMLDFHVRSGAVATLGVRQFSQTIPYGVVKVDGSRLIEIVEKPESKVFISGGVYLLSPEALDLIPADKFFDMPTLFQSLMSAGEYVAGFPIHEYWIDIGRIEDFERASMEYDGVFT